MQNLKSSNAKRRKLLYYLYHTPFVYFFPSIISRFRLKNILNNSFQEEYIQSRVRYYFKKNSNFRVSNEGKNLSELNEEKNTIFYTIQKNEFNIIEFCKNYDTMIEKAEFSKNKQKKNIDIIIHCLGGGFGLHNPTISQKELEYLFIDNYI